MKKEIKYIFETKEDLEMLGAVRDFIGSLSQNNMVKQGLTEKQAILCGDFYSMVVNI